jgi:polysaccharide pyruvyl transferase WcaK-like protein
MKRVCILGSNSGRNAGDAAILASIIHHLRRLRPETRLEVPVPRKRDLYRRFDPSVARAVPMMPWNLSLRFLGVPTLWSVIRSDVLLITDGIIFDVKLFNPLFNFLILLVFLVPVARLFRTKVVCFLVGIGPLRTRCGRRMARWVCDRCDDILVRETDSAALLREIGVDERKITLYADAALILPPAAPERVDAILRENGIGAADRLIGVNVNAYADRFLGREGGGFDEGGFAGEMARAIDLLAAQASGRKIVLVLTQRMDVVFAEKLLQRVTRRQDVVVLGNDRYSAEELMGVLGRMQVFVGMRLHSLILASAMHTPCIGLAYAPKVRHFMGLIGFPERLVELAELRAEVLAAKVAQVAQEREQTLPALVRRVEELKSAAERGFQFLAERYL